MVGGVWTGPCALRGRRRKVLGWRGQRAGEHVCSTDRATGFQGERLEIPRMQMNGDVGPMGARRVTCPVYLDLDGRLAVVQVPTGRAAHGRDPGRVVAWRGPGRDGALGQFVTGPWTVHTELPRGRPEQSSAGVSSPQATTWRDTVSRPPDGHRRLLRLTPGPESVTQTSRLDFLSWSISLPGSCPLTLRNETPSLEIRSGAGEPRPQGTLAAGWAPLGTGAGCVGVLLGRGGCFLQPLLGRSPVQDVLEGDPLRPSSLGHRLSGTHRGSRGTCGMPSQPPDPNADARSVCSFVHWLRAPLASLAVAGAVS